MLDVYPLQDVWLARPLSYPLLDNISNKSLDLIVLSNEMMMYINILDARKECNFFCKYCVSRIIAHNVCRSFVHISNIRQTSPKPNRFFFVQWLVDMYLDDAMVG